MLKAKLGDFYQMVDAARLERGESPTRIADAILNRAFPETMDAADREGCDKMLRKGVIAAIKTYLRKLPADERQLSLNDIAPDILPYVQPLPSASYYVPGPTGQGEYVHIAELCRDLNKLNAARRFMRMKAREVSDEADRLDDLYNYLAAPGKAA